MRASLPGRRSGGPQPIGSSNWAVVSTSVPPAPRSASCTGVGGQQLRRHLLHVAGGADLDPLKRSGHAGGRRRPGVLQRQIVPDNEIAVPPMVLVAIAVVIEARE